MVLIVRNKEDPSLDLEVLILYIHEPAFSMTSFPVYEKVSQGTDIITIADLLGSCMSLSDHHGQ
jgi:hypothetical protein